MGGWWRSRQRRREREGEAGEQVSPSPIPHPVRLELWLAPGVGLGWPFVQLSLTMAGELTSPCPPTGPVLTSGSELRLPFLWSLLSSQPLHPPGHSLCYLYARLWLPCLSPLWGPRWGTFWSTVAQGGCCEVRSSLFSPAVAGPGGTGWAGRLWGPGPHLGSQQVCDPSSALKLVHR